LPTGKWKRPRDYVARRCVLCGSDAGYALQVLTRTVGLGQSRRNRKMKMGSTVLLCEGCAGDLKAYSDIVSTAAKESLTHVQRRRPNLSAPLFETEV
jgi:hypothetical protein